MADFKPAFAFVLQHEDSTRSGKVTVDAGGRTRFGIAERFHPDLPEEFFAGPADDIADWTKISSVLALCAIIPASGLLAGCVSTWDRTTYVSLATSKALIDCAVAGYNHFDADIRHLCAGGSEDAAQDSAFDAKAFYLPQTREAQQAIEKARQTQVAAVEAFAAYAVAKVAKDKTATLQEKQAAVIGYLAQFPTLLEAVRELMGKKPVSAVKPTVDADNPVAAIAALRPAVDLGR